MELREIIEHYTQYLPNLSIAERIEEGRKHLFNFDYPFFSETYKAQFETNFIRRFYMREIGFETEGLFKFYLETWLNINMPYWNKMFESEQLSFDPFISYDLLTTYQRDVERSERASKDGTQNNTGNETNILSSEKDNLDTTTTTGNAVRDFENETTQTTDITETNNRTQNDTSNTDATNRNFVRDIDSQTADGRLQLTSNDNGTGVIEYASSIKETLTVGEQASETTNTLTGNDTSNTDGSITTVDGSKTTDTMNSTETKTGNEEVSQTQTNTTANNATSNENVESDGDEKENFEERKVGSIGVKTFSQMLIEYRDSFLRIEVDIHKEMNQLFMLVY